MSKMTAIKDIVESLKKRGFQISNMNDPKEAEECRRIIAMERKAFIAKQQPYRCRAHQVVDCRSC